MASTDTRTDRRLIRRRAVAVVMAVVLGSVATGTAFAGWLDHGAEILLSYAAAGLAWCL